MGKRELLLVVCFVIVGAVVYQVTAPEPDPNERGLSVSRFIEAARREIRGNRSSAQLTTTVRHPLTPELTELRVTGPVSEIDVTGEAREDVETTFYVHSTGYDDAEAARFTKESRLLSDRAAAALILRAHFPRGGRQRGILKIKVPLRLRIRVEPGSGRLSVSDVAAVEVAGTRGEASVRKIAGRVDVSHRGGTVVIEDAGSLEFLGRGGSLKLADVRGATSIKMEQGGEVTATRLNGTLEMEGRNTEITLEHLETTKGPIRINANGGTVRMTGLKSEARIDGRNTEITVIMGGAAAVAIYSEGEEVELTPPPGAFSLDALVIEGEITPDTVVAELGLNMSRTGDDKESRASGSVRGGGPTITVRSTRGDLRLQAREPAKPVK